MAGSLKRLRLSVKVALLGAGSVVATAAVLVTLAVWQSGQYQTLAQHEVDRLLEADLDHITQGVRNLVRTEDEAVQQQVDCNLNVARHILAGAGGVSLSDEATLWKAINQFTNTSMEIQLPRMLVGGQWLRPNTAPDVTTPVVDDVKVLVGDSATIFQIMNEHGDMLRVATTITGPNGERAIGTYIPATNPDGTANPVIAAVLEGRTYHGRAFVVDAWYLTAYEPIKDGAGRLVGMLYVGVGQKQVESRVRQAIVQTSVGKTGYVYVVGGQGEGRGRYIVSQGGLRDGEDIWESKDSDGRYVIQSIISKALTLKPGELATERYRWQNPGEPAPRWKTARLAYYAPWDWVIGVSVYEDELLAYQTILSEGRGRMSRTMVAAGLAITLCIGLLGVFVAMTITRPIQQITHEIATFIREDLKSAADVHGGDEIGILASTFAFMTNKLRQTMESLRRSEEKHRIIFENALEGIFLTSLDGRVLGANPASARMMGYDSSAEMVETVTDLRRQAYARPEDRDAITAAVLERGEVLGRDVQLVRKDGQRIWVSLSVSAVRDQEGKLLHLQSLAADITERKRAEEQIRKLNVELERRVEERTAELAAANRELSEFAYVVSHDLKAPLAAVNQLSQWIAQDYAPVLDDEGKEKLVLLGGRVKRMHSLIDAILHYSRIGRVAESRKPVDLGSLVRGVIEVLSPPDHIKVTVEGELPVVIADQTRMEQVFQNLIGNAINYMDKPQGTVIVRCEDRGDRWCFQVVDNGPGIDPKYHEKVFKIFQTLTPRDSKESTGVGLAVVKKIVERYGGQVDLQSEVGKGCTFSFALPKNPA